MQSHYFHFKQSTIHYRYSGEGPELVICFHGFGTYAATFDWLASHVPGHRFIAFDLPLHGDTKWNDGNTLSPEDLIDMIHHCPHAQVDRFSLMGYSMGGRISLHLLQLIPHRVTRLILLAPDGLHFSPYYWLATQTSGGNKLFRRFMHKPQGFIRMIRRMESWGMISKSIRKFVDLYLEDKHVRELVYEAWTLFRKFKPNLTIVIREINKRQIPTILLYGQYDTIIPLNPGKAFFQRVQAPKKMEILPIGHQVLHLKNAPVIAEAFNLSA
jgi:pimeloyl-ACP methyl ester carboxylesterase